jgi:hypothetical protein
MLVGCASQARLTHPTQAPAASLLTRIADGTSFHYPVVAPPRVVAERIRSDGGGPAVRFGSKGPGGEVGLIRQTRTRRGRRGGRGRRCARDVNDRRSTEIQGRGPYSSVSRFFLPPLRYQGGIEGGRRVLRTGLEDTPSNSPLLRGRVLLDALTRTTPGSHETLLIHSFRERRATDRSGVRIPRPSVAFPILADPPMELKNGDRTVDRPDFRNRTARG